MKFSVYDRMADFGTSDSNECLEFLCKGFMLGIGIHLVFGSGL
jgi:hypothetical protein